MRILSLIAGRTIGWRTAVGPLLGAVALVLVAAEGWSLQAAVHRTLDEQSRMITARATVRQAYADLEIARGRLMRALAWAALGVSQDQVTAERREAEKSLAYISQVTALRATPALASAMDAYVANQRETLNTLETPEIAVMLTVAGQQQAMDLGRMVREQIDALNTAAQNAGAAAMGAQRSASELGIGVAAVAGLLAVGIGLAAARSIAVPIRAMTDAMTRLAAGASLGKLQDSGLRELRAMSAAMSVFAANAERTKALEAEQAAARERRASEDERVRREAEAAAAAAAAQLVVGSIGKALAQVADGDLRVRVEEPLPPAYEQLRHDLNRAVETLGASMTGVADGAARLRASTAEIARAAQDLSGRVEQQAANLEQAATAVEEITASVSAMNENAQSTHAVVERAAGEAEQSHSIVGDAVAAMRSIESSASEIGSIIGVIDEIAFQTNLLALNAGVEAARAGEAGRGFAVVASEVRALAQRAAESARDIKQLVTSSREQVRHGAGLVDRAGQALNQIAGYVSEIAANMGQVTKAVGEQAKGLAEVNTTVGSLDQITQQTAAMAEQTTAASVAMAEDCAALGRSMERFRLDDRAAEPPLAA